MASHKHVKIIIHILTKSGQPGGVGMGQLVINKIITFGPLCQEFYYVMYLWD